MPFLSTAKRSVNSEPLSGDKAGEKARGAAIGEDFEIDKAGGAIDRDIGVATPVAQRRQVFDIDMNEAGRGVGLESDGRRGLERETGRQAVPLHATVNAAARQLGIEAAAHRLDDVIERQDYGAALRSGLLPIG